MASIIPNAPPSHKPVTTAPPFQRRRRRGRMVGAEQRTPGSYVQQTRTRHRRGPGAGREVPEAIGLAPAPPPPPPPPPPPRPPPPPPGRPRRGPGAGPPPPPPPPRRAAGGESRPPPAGLENRAPRRPVPAGP